MTPLEKKVLAKVRQMHADGRPAHSTIIARELCCLRDKTSACLGSLERKGYLRRRRIQRKRPASETELGWNYLYEPVEMITAETRITLCPPGYAEGFGLGKEHFTHDRKTKNGGEPWC